MSVKPGLTGQVIACLQTIGLTHVLGTKTEILPRTNVALRQPAVGGELGELYGHLSAAARN